MVSVLFAVLFHYAPVSLRPFRDASVPHVLLLIFITTFCIPTLSVLALRFTGSITSLMMGERHERSMPFIFISLFYLMTTYFFMYRLEMSEHIQVVFLLVSSLVVLTTLLTFFVKVSIHSASICGFVGFLLALKVNYPETALLWPLFFAVLLAGMTMSSRLYLNAHRPSEIYLGAGIGFSLCFTGALLYM